MSNNYKRRDFIRTAALAGIGFELASSATASVLFKTAGKTAKGTRVGIIGLDVSHSTAFTKLLNSAVPDPDLKGYRVVAAYPKGSNDIETSVSRIPEYTKQVQGMGVEIVSSIAELLTKVDVVLLNTNDGRLHLEQALPVFKAGKPVFIDKPLSASLKDAIAIYDAAKKYNVPVFSSSSMRYLDNIKDLGPDKIGKVVGAETYSPATLEKTHADLFWYGMHGVEMLYTVMGTGCKQVSRVNTPDTDVVVGIWEDGRVGTFRGTRTGQHDYGGVVFGEKATVPMKISLGIKPLLVAIINFFETGISPVSAQETLEIYAFMEAADESKRKGGAAVNVNETIKKASK